MNHYMLEGKKGIECDLTTWANWFENNHDKRCVASEWIRDYYISTVFLGMDHQYGSGPPLIFETMIFDAGDNDVYMTRYSTWEEAEEGHKKAIEWVKNECKYDDVD